MNVLIATVGRLKPGPERALVDDYLGRAGQAGRRLGLGPFAVSEIDERRARDPAAQSARLIEAIPADAHAIALDARGEALTSEALAALLARLRDDGRPAAAFLIGGADGHHASLRARADRLVSLGPMVWPHMLARVMLAEQLYRAVSILAGTPYHRG
ncbi:MAG TPA: 23S rRNA (pseudouridine(1915)-N(3))-methyltransferase RlmH [Thermohalobaculum sp.]|nr:23S rRNA (pseudouridine(1915)-N(3))-methyltransferase RlmH [Thermohalobaculum sp.]